MKKKISVDNSSAVKIGEISNLPNAVLRLIAPGGDILIQGKYDWKTKANPKISICECIEVEKILKCAKGDKDE